MSLDVATFAKGTKLEISAVGAGVYWEIKGITKWDVDPGGAGEPDKHDVTSGSTPDLVRQKLDGYSDKRSGKVGFDLLYDADNTQHADLQDASMDGTSRDFKLTLKTHAATKIFTFTARVSGFPIDVPHDKIITVKADLAITENTWAKA